MPELPEVETIAQNLKRGTDGPPIIGQRILRVSTRWPRHIERPSISTFRRKIQNRVIEDIGRRGKYLVVSLDEGTLLIHLRMSGDLKLTHENQERGPYEHTLFPLDSGWELRFSDARKFGKISLLEDPQVIFKKLGPEPLDQDFTSDVLSELIRGKQRMIKPLLMDQSFLAGMGNIYTDEALHIAKIHPNTKSNQLSPAQIHDLHAGIRMALTAGLRNNGASIDWVYRGGEFQNYFRVYQRTGEACPVCGTEIKRITLGQRGTHYCPTCQPEKSA
jgi:formamidopyrimidine-DNA glycosylase